MNFLNTLFFNLGNLLDTAGQTSGNTAKGKFAKGLEGTDYEFLIGIIDFIEGAMLPIIILLTAVAAIYAIVLGINMAKAEGDGREAAKKRIINFLIGAAVIIVLLVVLYVLAANITSVLGVTGWEQVNNPKQ